RMETYALPGTIQVTPRTYHRLCCHYELQPRGTIDVKGKGPMSPYLLIRSPAVIVTPAPSQ
ncbi:MAG: adenylate/guanylate cyclase domain-containing protein, partial [Solirubrobacteraceae bacterium]